MCLYIILKGCYYILFTALHTAQQLHHFYEVLLPWEQGLLLGAFLSYLPCHTVDTRKRINCILSIRIRRPGTWITVTGSSTPSQWEQILSPHVQCTRVNVGIFYPVWESNPTAKPLFEWGNEWRGCPCIVLFVTWLLLALCVCRVWSVLSCLLQAQAIWLTCVCVGCEVYCHVCYKAQAIWLTCVCE